MVKRYQIQITDHAWLDFAAEDVKASRMSWYAPAVTNPPRAAKRISQYLDYTERVLDWSPPSPTVAEQMAWYVPVSTPYFGRQMPAAVSVRFDMPLQPHYGGALLASIETVGSLTVGNRIESSGSIVTGRGIGTIP